MQRYGEDRMITLTCILICAVAPFILVFIATRLIIRFVEKILDIAIEKVFSLPEKFLDSIKEKFKNKDLKEKLPKPEEA